MKTLKTIKATCTQDQVTHQHAEVRSGVWECQHCGRVSTSEELRREDSRMGHASDLAIMEAK